MLSKIEWAIVAGTALVWAMIVFGGRVMIPDDVFFYLKIAGEIVDGYGSTFNDITPTNGYHPLWMLPLVALRVFFTGKDELVHAALALCGVLSIVALFLMSRLLRRLGIELRWPAMLLLGYYMCANPTGSEFHLSLVFLLLFLERAVVVLQGDTSAPRLLALGFLAGFAMLSRLDNVFLVGIVLVAITLSSGASIGSIVRAGVLIGIPAVMTVGPYLAWNHAYFGAFIPISGTVKATFVKPGLMKMGMQAIVLGAFALTLPFASSNSSRTSRLYWAMGTAAFIHISYVALRMSGTWPWYFVTELLASCLAASLWANRFFQPLALRTAVAGLAIAGLLGFAMYRRVAMYRDRDAACWYVDAAKAIDATVPFGEAIATTSSPGGIGYYSRRPVFAFDGLTLDFNYHREAARDGLDTYLRKHAINYLFTVAPESAEAMDFARRTKADQQFEDTAYILSPDNKKLDSLTIYSGLTAQPLGTIHLSALPIVARNFCKRDADIWRLH